MEAKESTTKESKEQIEEKLKNNDINTTNDEKEDDSEFEHPYKLKKKKTILGKVDLIASPSGELLPVTLSDVLIDEIAKNFFLRKLHHQILSKKYSKHGFNKKRQLFLQLFSKIRGTVKYHKYLYFTKLLDSMENFNQKEIIENNCDFGKIKIICKNKNIKEEDNNEKNYLKYKRNIENKSKEEKNAVMDSNIEFKDEKKEKEMINKKNGE